MGQYDLIFIYIGNERIDCRPIAWDSEQPIRYFTTCPHCAQLVEFNLIDVLNDKYFCESCNAGKDQHNEEIVKNLECEDDKEIESLRELLDFKIEEAKLEEKLSEQQNKSIYELAKDFLDNDIKAYLNGI